MAIAGAVSGTASVPETGSGVFSLGFGCSFGYRRRRLRYGKHTGDGELSGLALRLGVLLVIADGVSGTASGPETGSGVV